MTDKEMFEKAVAYSIKLRKLYSTPGVDIFAEGVKIVNSIETEGPEFKQYMIDYVDQWHAEATSRLEKDSNELQ